MVYNSSPFKALEKRLIGGVTLNHLCWAALGGVPTALLALQGKDDLGRLIRNNLTSLGVSTEFISSESDSLYTSLLTAGSSFVLTLSLVSQLVTPTLLLRLVPKCS